MSMTQPHPLGPSIARGRPPLLRRFGWLVVPLTPILGAAFAVWGYGAATEWFFLLPGVPSVEKMMEEPGRVGPLAAVIGVPGLPADVKLDERTASQFFNLYSRLRRTPRDTGAVAELGDLFHQLGFTQEADACYRRALQLDPPPREAGN
jgi:hypothetical protein